MTIDEGPGRPTSDEHSPYYAGYINQVPSGNVLIHLSEQIERTTALLQSLTAEQAAFQPTPADWSVEEVICHISDGERIFSDRALRIARGDVTPLAGFEQEPYVRRLSHNAEVVGDGGA